MDELRLDSHSNQAHQCSLGSHNLQPAGDFPLASFSSVQHSSNVDQIESWSLEELNLHISQIDQIVESSEESNSQSSAIRLRQMLMGSAILKLICTLNPNSPLRKNGKGVQLALLFMPSPFDKIDTSSVSNQASTYLENSGIPADVIKQFTDPQLYNLKFKLDLREEDSLKLVFWFARSLATPQCFDAFATNKKILTDLATPGVKNQVEVFLSKLVRCAIYLSSDCCSTRQSTDKRGPFYPDLIRPSSTVFDNRLYAERYGLLRLYTEKLVTIKVELLEDSVLHPTQPIDLDSIANKPVSLDLVVDSFNHNQLCFRGVFDPLALEQKNSGKRKLVNATEIEIRKMLRKDGNISRSVSRIGCSAVTYTRSGFLFYSSLENSAVIAPNDIFTPTGSSLNRCFEYKATPIAKQEDALLNALHSGQCYNSVNETVAKSIKINDILGVCFTTHLKGVFNGDKITVSHARAAIEAYYIQSKISEIAGKILPFYQYSPVENRLRRVNLTEQDVMGFWRYLLHQYLFPPYS